MGALAQEKATQVMPSGQAFSPDPGHRSPGATVRSGRAAVVLAQTTSTDQSSPVDPSFIFRYLISKG
jgi:hypothetical protein